jgi:hypothetical protein
VSSSVVDKFGVLSRCGEFHVHEDLQAILGMSGWTEPNPVVRSITQPFRKEHKIVGAAKLKLGQLLHLL